MAMTLQPSLPVSAAPRLSTGPQSMPVFGNSAALRAQKKDVFFGSEKPADAPQDLVTLKTGDTLSMQKVNRTLNLLAQMIQMMAPTADGKLAPVGLHTLEHLYARATDPTDPEAELCESSKKFAQQLGLADEQGEPDPDVLAIIRAGLEVQKLAQADLTPQLQQEATMIIQTETGFRALFFRDPLQVSMMERAKLAKEMLRDAEKAISTIRELLEKGDAGLEALRILNSLGIKNDLIAKAVDAFVDTKGLQDAALRKDSLLRALGDQDDKPRTRLTLFA